MPWLTGEGPNGEKFVGEVPNGEEFVGEVPNGERLSAVGCGCTPFIPLGVL